MHVLKILRDYLGLTQMQLARQAGIAQADVSEMESNMVYGDIDKYQRLSEFLGVSIQALVDNDCREITLSFFEKHKGMSYTKASSYTNMANGRGGEDYVFKKEKERVERFSPVLARLILPYYKLGKKLGYDMLSFNESGKPIYIEVKTTQAYRNSSVSLTYKETEKAIQLTQKGEIYQIHQITRWGKEDQTYKVFDFVEVYTTAQQIPSEYTFWLEPSDKITGIAYHRQKCGLSQKELADCLGILPYKVSLYENTGRRCPVEVYVKMAKLLNTSIDNLLKEYDVTL